MQYKEKIVKGIFISRPNRFIANVTIDGVNTVVHVPNTGRCKELLVKDCTVYLRQSDNPSRKTLFDLIAVEKSVNGKNILINMDSIAPNKVAQEWITSHPEYFYNVTYVKSEYTYGDSRFDFYFEYSDKDGTSHKMFLEVKGVTLEHDGIAMFPDAPTLRGVKHITELTDIKSKGEYDCGILFVIQMKGCHLFKPNYDTHRDFALALKNAKSKGVSVFATDCIVTPQSLTCDKSVNIEL